VEIQDVDLALDEVATLGFKGTDGALIKGARRGAPAFGVLEPSDIVTELNGRKVEDSTVLRNMVASLKPGTEVTMKVFRGGKEQTVKVTLGEQPDDLRTASASPVPSRGSNGQANADILGMRVATVTPDNLEQYRLDRGTTGAVVTAIRPNSPAAQSGLRPNDCITRINGMPIEDAEDVDSALAQADINRGVTLVVVNQDGTRSIFIQAGPN
jgi:serine protease Do